jgi:hypothetical protein
MRLNKQRKVRNIKIIVLYNSIMSTIIVIISITMERRAAREAVRAAAADAAL